LLAVIGDRPIEGVTEIACCTLRPVFASFKVSKYVPAKSVVGTMNHVVRVYALEPLLDIAVVPNWFTLEIATGVPYGVPEVTRDVPPMFADVIPVNPVTDMVTLPPDTAVFGAVKVGVPSTVRVAVAVSTGVLVPVVPIVNDSVYVPAATVEGNVKVTGDATGGNVPAPLTVVVPADRVTELTKVDPLSSCAEIGVDVRRALGVKPVPVIVTPDGMLPATIAFEPNVITGLLKMVSVVVALFPAASVTTMVSVPGLAVEETTNPHSVLVSKLPEAIVATGVVAGITVAGVTPTLYQLDCVPFMLKVCAESAAKPVPMI
jgi:hypothetical protein